MNEMRQACRNFRAQLEHALEGRAQPNQLAPLGWHEHLLACEPCRELFAREEALEELLASLPEPRLSAARRNALLACLRADVARDAALDHLLESDLEIYPPAGLAGRVIAGVEAARLDELLELDRELVVPTGMAARVLDGLQSELAPAPASRFVLDRRWIWPAAAAAAALIFFALPGAEERAEPVIVEGPTPVAPQVQPFEPDPAPLREVAADAPLSISEQDDMLAVLDLLEEDALWSEENLDLELSAGIDITSEWLLEYTQYESVADDRDPAEGEGR